MEVTASGMPRPRRNQLAQLVERLRGTWSGALNVGRTAAVVVEGPEADIDWAAAKLVVALQHGIPIVSADWLLDSQAHGFLLSTAHYRLEPPPLGRRSSAASTSAAAAAPQPAQTAATVNQAAALPPPAQQQRAAAPGSPAAVELEVLRGEAMQPRHSPLLLQRSPHAAAATPASKPLVAPDELQEPLQSPAADSHEGSGEWSPAVLLPGSPLQLPDQPEAEPESVSQSVAASTLPFSPERRSPSSGATEAAVGDSPAWSAGSLAELRMGRPGGADSGAAAAVTPCSPSAGTDSDTKIARFLSRRPMVTLARGSCLPRRCMLPDSGSSSSASSYSSGGTSIRSSLSGSGSGSAERMEGARRYSTPGGPAVCGMILSMHEQPLGEDAESASDAEDEPAAFNQPRGGKQMGDGVADTRGMAAAGSPAAISSDAAPLGLPPSASPQQYPQSVLRMDPPVAEGRLPATTLIRLGPQLGRPPLRSTWEGLLERHGCGSCSSCGSEGSSHSLPAVSFHASAEALPVGGHAISFAAGDTRHGAVMLYDIKEGGQRVYALALVQAIYRWHDEVWMEHRYLLTREDLMERPSWMAALQGLEMRPCEVLLTENTYHSPMHLITGDFSLSFPGRAQRARRGQQQAQFGSSAMAGGSADAAIYTCRHGFDATAGAVVPLGRALDGFAAAGGS